MQTSADRVYIGEVREYEEDGLVEFKPKKADNYRKIERGILRRLLKGEEIKRWKFDWQGLWVVFPYDVVGEKAEVFSKQKLKENYPHSWEFFKDHEDRLKRRDGGAWAEEENWWAFGRKQNIEKFESDKIMLGVLRQEPSFVPDTEGEYYFVGGGTAGGYGLRLREEFAPSSSDTLYFGGVLNSRVIEFYHKHISFIFNSKYYSYGQTFLEPLPIVVSEGERKERMSEIAEKIRDSIEEITELEFKRGNILNYVASYDRNHTILDLVRSVDLDDDDYRQDPIRKNDKMEVDTEEVYQVVMKRGHTLDFENERVRDFVYDLLKAQDRRLGRSEILNTEVPEKDDVLELMEEYRADEEEIDELEGEAEELQEELDEIILRDVYELDDSDIEVIDEFLEVW